MPFAHRAVCRTVAACILVLAGVVPSGAQLFQPDIETSSDRVASAPAATLRGLDKVSGAVSDMEISVGQTVQLGRLQITLGDCRYPQSDPSGEAYAWLVIRDAGIDQHKFMGWMVASSPALNALEDPRYDVWVIRCNI